MARTKSSESRSKMMKGSEDNPVVIADEEEEKVSIEFVIHSRLSR